MITTQVLNSALLSSYQETLHNIAAIAPSGHKVERRDPTRFQHCEVEKVHISLKLRQMVHSVPPPGSSHSFGLFAVQESPCFRLLKKEYCIFALLASSACVPQL